MSKDEMMDMLPAQYVVHLFGGTKKLAEILRLHASTISHWLYGQGPKKTGLGEVPARYQKELLQRAKLMGLVLTPSHLIYGGQVKAQRVLVPK